MWYFAWVLGVGFAGSFSILNAMWLELHETGLLVLTENGR
jgi:cyd operon protein YbgT